MKKIFSNFNMSWKFLILFSVIIGLFVGILNRIPFLNDTSFTDIAVYLEMWIILAIFIINNTKSWKEACLKCFVFFLISQPLIYFTEVIIDVIFFDKEFLKQFILYFNNYYIHGGWLLWTFLTIPGAFICFQVKKDNILSAFILAVATSFLSFTGISYFLKCILRCFPNHLLNSLICLVMAYLLIFILLSNKRNRIISIIVTSLFLILGIVLYFFNNNGPIASNVDFSFDNPIKTCEVDNESIAICSISDDEKSVTIYSNTSLGNSNIYITDVDGNTYKYLVNSTSYSFDVTLNK